MRLPPDDMPPAASWHGSKPETAVSLLMRDVQWALLGMLTLAAFVAVLFVDAALVPAAGMAVAYTGGEWRWPETPPRQED